MTTAQIEAKFRRYAASRLTSRQVDEVIQAVARLEDVVSVRDFLATLQSECA